MEHNPYISGSQTAIERAFRSQYELRLALNLLEDRGISLTERIPMVWQASRSHQSLARPSHFADAFGVALDALGAAPTPSQGEGPDETQEAQWANPLPEGVVVALNAAMELYNAAARLQGSAVIAGRLNAVQEVLRELHHDKTVDWQWQQWPVVMKPLAGPDEEA